MKLYLSLAGLYLGLVLLANYLASLAPKHLLHVPFTPYVAPYGVLAIGAILVLRDWMQQLRGLWWTMPLVYAAGLISWVIGDAVGWTNLQKIAVASVVAFSVSETLEAVVFTPLRKKSLTVAVGLSATVGVALDSFIFLTLAFGSLAFFWGQFWGKTEMVVVGVVLTLWRRFLLPTKATASA